MLSRLPITATDHLSSTVSHASTDVVDPSGSALSYSSETSGQLCVNRRKRRVLCLPVSLTQRYLPGRQGFILHTLLPCLIGPESPVLPVNLPPSAPAAVSGSPMRLQFYGLYCHRRRASLGSTTSPYPVPLHYGSVRRILGLAYPSGIDLLPTAIKPVRCPPRTWFLPHASSRHPISGNALALLALPFRPVTAGDYFRLPDHCQKLGQCVMPGARLVSPSRAGRLPRRNESFYKICQRHKRPGRNFCPLR